MTKSKIDSSKVYQTKANTNKFQHKTVCNSRNLKSCLNKSSTTVIKFCTVIDLTDDLITKEYVTEVPTVIEIFDLTDRIIF